MHDLTPNQIKKIASGILVENDFPIASRIYMIVDDNQSSILISFKVNNEPKSISTSCTDIEDYKNKFTKQVKLIV
jgi:hypothetical protein